MQVESKPRNLPADQRRAVTVEAVIELTAEQNPGDITTAAIAQRMNLTQGALFRHFPSKDAIWQAVMEWVAERLLQRVDRAIQGADSPLQALEAVFMAHIEVCRCAPRRAAPAVRRVAARRGHSRQTHGAHPDWRL
jgi:TetR/AcrR family transcriptional regulator